MKIEGYQKHHGMIFPTKLTSDAFENGQLGKERYFSQLKKLLLRKKQPKASQFEKPKQAEVDIMTF